MRKIRFGITGSGFMGHTHAEAIRRLDGAELVAITGGSRAPGLAEKYGIALEPDVNALAARADIDAVVVTTPHHVHVSEALAAFEHRKHALVEKPLATSVEDCDRMMETAARAGLVLAVGYQQRFRINNVRACELVRSGAIGNLLTVQVSMPLYLGGLQAGGFGSTWQWWGLKESIGHVLNSAPHAIDLLRWFTAAEVSTVSAFSRTFGPNKDVEDTTLAIFELSNGTLCSLYSSCALPAPLFPGEDFRFRIVGSTGLLDLNPYGELRQSGQDGWRVVSTQPTVGHEDAGTAFGDVRMQAYRDQMASFLDAISGKPMAAGSGADGRAGVQTCRAMLTSSKEGRWVRLG